MDQAISAADANRNFSALLRAVRSGKSYVVTSHGKPVARVVPASEQCVDASASRDLLLKRLTAQQVVDVGRWTRDELYEDDI